jgi:transcription-repair coupling factor (superfamily II helicase)
MRLILYKRIAACDSDDALREMQVEMIDRFGLLPAARSTAVQREFAAPAREALRRAHARTRRERAGTSSSLEETRVDPLQLVQLVQEQPLTFDSRARRGCASSEPLAPPAERESAGAGAAATPRRGGARCGGVTRCVAL